MAMPIRSLTSAAPTPDPACRRIRKRARRARLCAAVPRRSSRGRPSAGLGRFLGAALACGALPAHACGESIGAEAVARAIEAELQAQGLHASVACPADVQARPGAAIACTAIATDDPHGTALVVHANVLDGGDRIALAPEAALAIGGAVPAIRGALADLGIEASRIDCAGPLARVGEPLACDIDASDGRRLRWRAVLGEDGRARGELVDR